MKEVKCNEPKLKLPFKINWKMLIVGYLGASLIPLMMMMVCGWQNGGNVSMGELFTAIVSFQMGAFFLIGFLMGYWAGVWPWVEMALVFAGVFQASLKTIVSESPELKSNNLILLCLVLYGGGLLGGVGLGILLKKITKKNPPLTDTESEVSNGE